MEKFPIILLLISCFFSQVIPAKIIIIGAGASGIAAATRLIEKNVTDFIILEAEERLGGRIHSVFLLDGEKGGSVDLGGECVSGEEGNVVFEFAKDHLTHTDEKKKSKTYYSDGSQVDAKLALDINTFFDNLKGEFEGRMPISAANAFNENFNDVILKKNRKDPTKTKHAVDMIETCEHRYYRRYGAFDWTKLLLNDHSKVQKGAQEMHWGGLGFKYFLDLLMMKFGDEHRLRLFPIYYHNTVENINWGINGKVKIQTKEGGKHEAEHVIFTPSVGVLKERHEKLFDPKLPANKVDAIKNAGFDATMKVALQYSQKWWGDDLYEFAFVWSREDEKKLSEKYNSGSKKNGQSWLKSFYRLFAVPGLPNTLIAWFTGPLVPEIEKLNVHEIKQGANFVIKKFLGKDYNVTEPEIVIPFNDVILKQYAKDPAMSTQALDIIGTCENAYLRRYGAFDWTKLLLNDHYQICKGEQEMNWGGLGFKYFLDLLMAKFGDEHRLRLFPIYYHNTVDNIIWGGSGKVKIQTKEGGLHEADHVIFTPSVGVLKERHEKLFDPKLPANKVDAIKNTGFDATMKVVLQYPQKWWGDDLYEFAFVWRKEDEEKLSEEYKSGPKMNGKSWLNSFYRLFAAPGLPNTLIGWFTGPLVPEIEKLNTQEIEKGVHFIIKKFLGKSFNVTEPKLVIPTNWYSNSNFRGTYSYETVASANRKPQVQTDLAEPLFNKDKIPTILFAGEHTHETHFGTVHGAVESGYRAADELLEHINKVKSTV